MPQTFAPNYIQDIFKDLENIHETQFEKLVFLVSEQGIQ